MSRWVDVEPGSWYYEEVMEATNIVMPHDRNQYFVAGMTYNVFEPDAPYIYEEYIAVQGQSAFPIPSGIDVSQAPLSVYIDGVQVFYREIVGDLLYLYSPAQAGAVVSILSIGKPVLDANGRPTSSVISPVQPFAFLNVYGGSYSYNMYVESVVIFGKRLWRANSKEDIGYRVDLYYINNGVLYVPFNFNNVSCTVTYAYRLNGVEHTATAVVKPTSSAILYNNRFFPDAKMYKKEFIAFVGRLLELLYYRFTDTAPPLGGNFSTVFSAYQGQQYYHLEFPVPFTSSLSVKVNGVLKAHLLDYSRLGDNTVWLRKPVEEGTEVVIQSSKFTSNRFIDIPANDYSIPYLYFLEDLVLANGQSVLPDAGSYFMPENIATRAYMASVANRVRKWCLERFI